MSETDPRLNDEAVLAAMAFVRRAIEYSETAGGAVAEDLQPYLEKVAPLMEHDAEGNADIGPAMLALLAALGQLGGVCFVHMMRHEETRRTTVAELLAKWDEFEMACALDPETGL